MNYKKGTILIVEDEFSSVALLKDILREDYYSYDATNGQEALNKTMYAKPDIILLDIGLPGGMDGYEVINKLKSDEETKDIPVIFTTAHTAVEDERKCYQLGAADYIGKPYDRTIAKHKIDLQMQIVNQKRQLEQINKELEQKNKDLEQKNKELEETIKLSNTDNLTQLCNRRFFDTQFGIEWERAKRDDKPISLLLLDVDYFKVYNDTYGHPQGDRALQIIASVANSVIKSRRPTDFVARFGGEEFVILLPGADMGIALAIAEELREKIEGTVIPTETQCETRVKASIGVSTHKPKWDTRSTEDFTNNIIGTLYTGEYCSVEDFINNAVDTLYIGDYCLPEKLIKDADDALYRAKDNGRNRVEFEERRISDVKTLEKKR